MSLIKRIKEEGIRIKTIMPRFLQLEVSKDCNLKCIGCYRRDSTSTADLKGEHNLSLEAVKRILGMIPTVKTVTFLGDGEPLMNKELNSILKYLTSRGVNTWLTTNGTLIKGNTIREWEDYNITELHISVDSTRKEVYEQIRVGAHFKEVMEVLQIAGKSRIPTYINFLAYQETISDLPDIIRLASNTGCKGINMLAPIFLTGSDLNGVLTRVRDNEINRAYLGEAAKLAQKHKIKWIGGVPGLIPFFRHCNFPFALPYITLNGDVYGCCYAVGVGRTEWYQDIPQKIRSSDYLMGNIYDTPFKDIWLGESYRELRKAVKLSEHPRGYKLSPYELQKLRSRNDDYRFSYCKSCLWRWGSAC